MCDFFLLRCSPKRFFKRSCIKRRRTRRVFPSQLTAFSVLVPAEVSFWDLLKRQINSNFWVGECFTIGCLLSGKDSLRNFGQTPTGRPPPNRTHLKWGRPASMRRYLGVCNGSLLLTASYKSNCQNNWTRVVLANVCKTMTEVGRILWPKARAGVTFHPRAWPCTALIAEVIHLEA